MPFVFFKKKTPIFGANIEPNCIYCKSNMGQGEKIICLRYKHQVCSKYSYDPYKREPLKKPVLQKYSEEDFKI